MEKFKKILLYILGYVVALAVGGVRMIVFV